MRVAVLAGGRSSEHEVSLESAASVRAGLEQAGHEVVDVRLARNGSWTHQGLPLALHPGQGLIGCDVVWPVLHGPFGEDGTVQGLLELLGVAYVGAGVLASSLCMDKVVFKDLMRTHGIPQVEYVALRADAGGADGVADLGWPVFVKPARLGSSVGISKATDEESMRAAVAAIEGVEGAVGALVNNAGYSQSGAVESVPIDQVRRQFETNVFGLIRMCQLVLPGMRGQHWGRIVNLSSMGGKLTFPGGGMYHASKYAVEAISDALRFEVRGFGVEVIVIEPGLIVTNFGDTAAASVGNVEGPYASFNSDVARATEQVYKGPLSKLGGGPETVAGTISAALGAKRPKTRYPVTPSARVMIGQRRLMPDRVWDLLMRTQFPTPKP
jgi:NAD(P)-dependent dehydrogenase (short-subunit alcohol dehydrogenase family)